MQRSVHVLNSHAYVHDELLGAASTPEGWQIASDRDSADILIFPVPVWPDPDAPEPLQVLRPRDLDRLFVYSQEDEPIAWAPGMYTSLRRAPGRRAAFTGGFYVPIAHAPPSPLPALLDAAADAAPELLWSFAGTVANARVRARIAALSDERGLVVDTQRWNGDIRWRWWEEPAAEEVASAFRTFASTIASAKFVLCPRGHGLSTVRLFEALQAGRCPVILSDGWMPPPFVDWTACSITVPESDVEELPRILREREPDAEEYGARARQAWEEHFAPSRRLHTLVSACLELDARLGRGPRRWAATAAGIATVHTFRRGTRRLRRPLHLVRSAPAASRR